MDYAKESLKCHEQWLGKIEVVSRVPVTSREELSLAYTPGVAAPCLEIQNNADRSYDLTRRHNLCAVITDGSAVLGLGNIGPEAGMPVMEGKCALFKSFGDVDAFPLCVKSQEVDTFVNAVQLISGSFGGINLEDISAPRCFEIETKLKALCERFSLPMNERITGFSKGTQKRAQICLGLALNPRVLLCDETFDGLDPVMRDSFKRVLSEETVDRGMITVLAGHNQQEMEDICDSVGFLHEGKLVCSGDLDALAQHIEHFLALDGEKTLCFGSDFDGCDPLTDGITGLESIPGLYTFLRQRGYSETLLEDLFWNNLRRMFD